MTTAYDQRFAIAYVSSSGEGGAKILRRNRGEIVENVAGSGEYYWMAKQPGDFSIVDNRIAAPIYVDSNDFWGVGRALPDYIPNFGGRGCASIMAA